ncbi:MAG: dockerin type I repeat-containing protein [Oscillospiraceae bacterium]|nr:dockerin type I repeat-containing protein [Oscillospiraceae bacterium]
MTEPATVFLGVDSRLAAPEWLSGWTKTTDTFTDSGDPVVTYEIWRRDVAPEETVTIGMNGNSGTVNFLAAVKPYEAEPERIAGDVDTNGKCDVLDIVMLQKWLHCAGTLTSAEAADMNADGCVDVFDLALLKRALLR